MMIDQIIISGYGKPEKLKTQKAQKPTLGVGEVGIEVHYSGINFADIMARLGIYPDAPKAPCVVGYEVSGIVKEVADGVNIKPGTKVAALTRFGGYSSYVCVDQAQVVELKPEADLQTACAIPVVYLTAYQMLVEMGRIRQNDKILVHALAGGVGLAALEIAKIFGAKVFGTASAKKHQKLKERGADFLVDYHTQDFLDAIRQELGPKDGLDLALDSIGGESWQKSFKLLRPTGRLIAFGFSANATGYKASKLKALKNLAKVPWLRWNPISLMYANKGVMGVNMLTMWPEKERISQWLQKLVQWWEEGKINPTVDQVFNYTEAPKAHQYIQDKKNFGKALLRFSR